MTDRYNVSHRVEGQYQPGSDDKVLLNRLGITDTKRMEELEFDLLAKMQGQLLDEIEVDQPIPPMICATGTINGWRKCTSGRAAIVA